MQLYVTLTSPYARMARVLIIEKGMEDRVEVVPVQTRVADSPYYAINPSGRVPSLVTETGDLFEDSGLICAYLDSMAEPRILAAAEDWPARRLEAMARSMLDGVALWGREFLYRSETERSPTIIAHENARALRLASAFNDVAASGALSGPVDMTQITLGCMLLGRAGSLPGFTWREDNPHLVAWAEEFDKRDSMQRTRAPE